MRASWMITTMAATALAGAAHTAPSDRIISIATMAFVTPRGLPSACSAKLHLAKTEAEASAALGKCKIGFDRDHYSRLKSKTPPAEWEALLAAAPIGRVTLSLNGSVGTFTVVRQERVLSMASMSETFPIRRVLYEGVLDGSMQTALTPIHDMDGVIHVLRAHKISFVEDSGTLLARSIPTDIALTLTERPGEPIVVQGKDHGVIYARKVVRPAE